MNAVGNRNRLGALPYVFGALLGVSLGLVIISGVLFYNSSRSDVSENVKTVAAAGLPAVSIDDSRRSAIVTATERVAPAVVSITSQYTKVVRSRRSPFGRDFFDYFFNVPEPYKRKISSLGSGVIIDEDGYILTNEHVIHNAEMIEVTLSDGRTVAAAVVGSAASYDVALLKIEGENLPYVPLGDSDGLFVGEWAIAIGQPFGQLLNDTQPTVTVGVISALRRDVKSDPRSEQVFKDMIQTDAAINPGNSGGPLVNSHGEVIGINTFIFSGAGGGNLGMGFAIPINRGKWVLEEFQKYGRVRDVWVGITVRPITPELAAGLNLTSSQGLLIQNVEEDSPADDVQLKVGDVILEVNDRSVGTTYEANRIIFGSRIGDRLSFKVDRRGELKVIEMELAERPNEI